MYAIRESEFLPCAVCQSQSDILSKNDHTTPCPRKVSQKICSYISIKFSKQLQTVNAEQCELKLSVLRDSLNCAKYYNFT